MSNLVVLFLTVPLVTAFVGYITNWAAVKMIFHPHGFVGVGPLGWQGIIPRLAPKFATDIATTLTENGLLTVDEIVDQLDPDELEGVLRVVVAEQAPALARDVAEAVQPGLWAELAEPVQQMVADQLSQQTMRAGRDTFDRLRARSAELLDIEGLVFELLTGENTDRLSRLTQEIGAKEFRFIVAYGGVFGLLIGLVQAALFQILGVWWFMPIIGVFVGLITNWLAIQMIFRPVHPRRFFGLVTYQGLFPKRQAEISADYGRLAGEEIFTPAHLIGALSQGEAGTAIALEVTSTVSTTVEDLWPMVTAMLPQGVEDPEVLERVKATVALRLLSTLPTVQPQLEAYMARKLTIGDLIESKLAALPKERFERILRGVFEEDEITLILIGGVLGGLVGLLQGFIVLAVGL
ncbi:hypothetical protein BH20ACT2_BH20ACT2_09600 [soil metagenome]